MVRKIRLYWPLIKAPQTALLLATGIAGYLSAGASAGLLRLVGLVVSLLLAISGSTMLNMCRDRDIDARMVRTRKRPLAAGALSQAKVLPIGALLSVLGVGGAMVMAPLYGLVVLSGWFFDVVVYTLWLKRRTCWSIVWGGVSGAMPILAGRVLAIGRVDGIGLLLALAVLFWIPTHTVTFSIKYREDYARAGVPTFLSTYGDTFTRAVLALSSVLAALAIGWASVLIGLSAGYLSVIAVLATGLLLLALASFRLRSEWVVLGLFKYASVYMFSAMVILATRGLG